MPAVVGFVGGMFGFGAGAAFSVAGGAAFGGWVAGAAFGGTVLGGLAVKLLTSVAITALAQALTPELPQGGGITISTTLRGEHQPETIVLGRYATAGQAICPPYSHGGSHEYLTHVIELCSAPGASLHRLMIGDEWVELGATPHPDYGHPVLGERAGLIWVRYYDGRQTAADPMLLSRYGGHPDRPWTADMIGAGLCYAILTFRFDHERQTSVPRYRFELTGLPLYDPRKDDSAGGIGPHRLAEPATWEPTENPAVIAWNIMRGIPLPGGEVWGGNITDPGALPWSVWTAAMNRCDQPVALSGGGSEPAYRTGFEAALDLAPAAALEEIFKACSATVADLGHGWGIVVGAPALPVHGFTDDDVLRSRPQELDPFPGIEDTFNAVSARYPDPDELYETKEAPRRTNAAWEAADAFGRRMASLSLPAVPYRRQVQRLMDAWIKDERRFRRHVVCLPPDAAHVELIDTVEWSSARNGYVGKDFSVHEIVEDPRTGIRQLSLRERDPADYSWVPGFELPSVPTTPGTTPAAPSTVSGFSLFPVTLTDNDGRARRPAIGMSWDGGILAQGLRWELRLAGSATPVANGTTQAVEAGALTVSQGILPATSYEGRARLIAARPTAWTAWAPVTTDPVRLAAEDLDEAILADIDQLMDWMEASDDLIAAIQTGMGAESDRIDGLVQGVRDDLADEAAAIRLELAQGLADGQGYADTAIVDYDLIVQGQLAAMAGQIEQLTAALTSENLIANGSAASAMDGWTAVNAGRLVKDGSADALVLAAPEPAMFALGSGTTGSIAQTLAAFAVGEDDRWQLRFQAASTAATRTLTVRVTWLDGTGAAIGAEVASSLTISPANQWRVYSLQLDPPDAAVGASMVLDKVNGGTRLLMTAIEASTVNIAIEARLSELEAARVTDQAALATWRNAVETRFDASDAAISAEVVARSNADLAIGTRIDTVEAVNATQGAAIANQATAIANAAEAITQMDERLTAQFGGTQMVRDPEFLRDLAFWSGPLADVSRLVARNRASAEPRLADMPAARAIQLTHTDIGGLVTGYFPVSTAERYDLGGYCFRAEAASPQGRCYVQWANEANVQVGPISAVNGAGAPGAWHYMAASGLVAPAGASKARVGIQRSGGSAGLVWVTGVTLTRQAAFDFAAAAEILTVKQAQAAADSAFAAWTSTMEARVGGVEGVNTTQASQIANRYTKAETNSAISAAIASTTATLTDQINQRATTTALNALSSRVTLAEGDIAAVSDALTTVSATLNEASASGRLRVSAASTPAGADARIGLTARASIGATAASAALFLEARSDGTSRVSVLASRFAIVNSTGPDPGSRVVPFKIVDGQVYIDTAVIREAEIDTLHLKNGAVVGGYTTVLSGARESTAAGEIARFVVPSQWASRGIVLFECTRIDTADSFSSAWVDLQLNGTALRRGRSTVMRLTGPSSPPTYDRADWILPVNLAAGSNVFRLLGSNIRDVSYSLDILAFKR